MRIYNNKFEKQDLILKQSSVNYKVHKQKNKP